MSSKSDNQKIISSEPIPSPVGFHIICYDLSVYTGTPDRAIFLLILPIPKHGLTTLWLLRLVWVEYLHCLLLRNVFVVSFLHCHNIIFYRSLRSWATLLGWQVVSVANLRSGLTHRLSWSYGHCWLQLPDCSSCFTV